MSDINEIKLILLAHPNVKAFITHGGLLSTMESIYHAVPILGIPIFADQTTNIALAESYGYGKKVSFLEISENKLYLTLRQLLDNLKYILQCFI